MSAVNTDILYNIFTITVPRIAAIEKRNTTKKTTRRSFIHYFIFSDDCCLFRWVHDYYRIGLLNLQCPSLFSSLPVLSFPFPFADIEILSVYKNLYVLTRWLQLRFDIGSTAVRLQFDRATTIRRPTSGPGCCAAA